MSWPPPARQNTQVAQLWWSDWYNEMLKGYTLAEFKGTPLEKMNTIDLSWYYKREKKATKHCVKFQSRTCSTVSLAAESLCKQTSALYHASAECYTYNYQCVISDIFGLSFWVSLTVASGIWMYNEVVCITRQSWQIILAITTTDLVQYVCHVTMEWQYKCSGYWCCSGMVAQERLLQTYMIDAKKLHAVQYDLSHHLWCLGHQSYPFGFLSIPKKLKACYY